MRNPLHVEVLGIDIVANKGHHFQPLPTSLQALHHYFAAQLGWNPELFVELS